jgi:hypothetical protein
MIAYDPRDMTWDEYNKLMFDLFSSSQLGFVPEERWRDWVDGLNGIGDFVQSGVPDHRYFDRWQDWATAVVGIITIQPTL